MSIFTISVSHVVIFISIQSQSHLLTRETKITVTTMKKITRSAVRMQLFLGVTHLSTVVEYLPRKISSSNQERAAKCKQAKQNSQGQWIWKHTEGLRSVWGRQLAQSMFKLNIFNGIVETFIYISDTDRSSKDTIGNATHQLLHFPHWDSISVPMLD